MLTKNDWIECHPGGGAVYYVQAMEDIVRELNYCLKDAKNYKELKNEITALVKERKQFIKFANKNLE